MAWGLERFISSLTDNNVLPANIVQKYPAGKWLTFLPEILNRSTVEVINKRPTVSQIDQQAHTDDTCGIGVAEPVFRGGFFLVPGRD